MRIQLFINGALVFEEELRPGDKADLKFDDGKATQKFSERQLAIFDSARKLYPGKKLGNETEFFNFKRKHRDWAEELPKLLGAVQAQIVEKKKAKVRGDFVPEWPMFSVWINQRRWEMEMERPQPVINTEVKFREL